MKKKCIKLLSFVIMLVMLTGVFASSFSAASSTFSVATRKIVMMYVNRPNVWRFGTVGYISEDRKQTPYYAEDGSIMVPVSYFAECFEGTAEESGKSTKVTISGKTFDVASEKKDGVSYASVSELCKKSGKYLHTESNGLFAFGSENVESFLSWTTHLNEMRDLVQSFIFDKYTGDDIYNALTETTGNKQHPRLTYSEDEFAEIRKTIKDPDGDAVYKAMSKQIIKAADLYMKEPLYTYTISDGIRLEATGQVRPRIMSPAIAYLLTLDEKYAKRAYEEMENICKFNDLNPYHFLDVGQISCGLAYGYDLLYNWMNDSQRAFIRENMMRLVINEALRDVHHEGTKRSYRWNKDGNVCNWRCVVGCGVGCTALVILDELEGADKTNAIEVLGAMLNYQQPEMMLFAPSGAYEEGLSYWEFALTYYTFFMKALQKSCGTDFGYVDLPGLNMTNDFMVALNGNAACFTYHHDFDMSKDRFSSPLMFFADYFGKYEQGALRTKLIKSGNVDNKEDPFRDFILYSPSLETAEKQPLVCDAYFPVSEDAMMRTGWGNDDIYVGLHCDRPFGNGNTGNEPFDAGLFVLQGKGEKWFFDQGRDNYELSPIENTYWYRGEGHNTVIFNPDKNPEMKKYANAHISAFSSSDTVSYAVGEMTPVYKSEIGIKSFQRGVKLNKQLGIVTVQDEIKVSKPVDMYWFAHTDAEIMLAADGKSATLLKNGKYMKAKIVNGENAVFSVMDAEPLPTSPKVEGQRKLDGISKLAIHIENCSDINLCVQFCFGTLKELNTVDEFKLISEWEKAYPSSEHVTPNTEKDDPAVTTDDGNHSSQSSDGMLKAIVIISAVAVCCAVIIIAVAATGKKKSE